MLLFNLYFCYIEIIMEKAFFSTSQPMLDWWSSAFLLPLENVPVSVIPSQQCSQPPCHLISVGPLISTKCSNYARIS